MANRTLPPAVLTALQESEIPQHTIDDMTPKQCFAAYCNWHGLINWGDRLWEIVESLQSSDS